jgi:hypothetical protein
VEKAEAKSKDVTAQPSVAKEKTNAQETPPTPAAKSSAGMLIAVGGIIVVAAAAVVWFVLFQ